jgi:hypothetical protein
LRLLFGCNNKNVYCSNAIYARIAGRMGDLETGPIAWRFAALMPGFSDGSGDPHHLINAGAVA